MCLVCVFIFVKKAEHMYEITIFKSRERTPCLYPFVAHLFPLPISLLFPQQKTKPLHSSSPLTPQNIHGWASRSLDLISIVSIPRSSTRSSFCRCRPITPISRFESHFHLVCQWVLEQRVKSSFFTQMFVFWFLFFFFSSPIGKTHFSCSLFVVETIFDLQSKHTRPTFSKSRRVFLKSFAVETIFDLQPIRFVIFLNILFGCQESVRRLNI